MTDRIPQTPAMETGAALVLRTDGELAQIERYVGAADAANTIRAYLSDWRDVAVWCAQTARDAWTLAPLDVAAYCAQLADRGYAIATISRRIVSISRAYDAKGIPSPARSALVRQAFRGMQRAMGRPVSRVAPITLPLLQAIAVRLGGQELKATRDRALLLVGFAAALRRSELSALDVSDVEWCPEGVYLLIRGSKTDTTRAGHLLSIPHGKHPQTCPVRALRAWLELAHGPLFLETPAAIPGPLFQSVFRSARLRGRRLPPKDVSRVIKARVAEVGEDPARYGGHSLRAGLVTEALAAGAPEWVVQRQTRHASTRQLGAYNRRRDHFNLNAARFAGL